MNVAQGSEIHGSSVREAAEGAAGLIDRAAFEGVRVIELAQFVFVPGGAAILADFGAEVIKIEEPLRGDPYRSLEIHDGRATPSANLAMEQNNRGKKSLALDLKSAQGREVFFQLIASADVFVTSLRPEAIERLGFGVEDLRRHNPNLIYVRGNGLGFNGSEAHRPGFDTSTFWARGGFADSLRPAGHDRPVGPRPAVGDHTGSLNIALALATALFRRERTGVASVIDVSLLGGALWLLSSDLTVLRRPGYVPEPRKEGPGRQPLIGCYRCRDDSWLYLMFLDPARYWPDLCQRLGRPELIDDPRFASVALRADNAAELVETLSAIFEEADGSTWRERFANWDAPWEFVQTLSEVARDPQALANGHFFEIEVSDGTKIDLVSAPISVDGSPQPINPRRAPLKGEHTAEILGGLGLTSDQIASLHEGGVVA